MRTRIDLLRFFQGKAERLLDQDMAPRLKTLLPVPQVQLG